jgi:hypothetical protein
MVGVMGWNFDMSAAPKGYTETRTRKNKDGSESEYDHYVSEKIIAAGNDNVVTISRWLPDQGRWNMFSADTPPNAWQPWPEHYDA